MLAAAMAVMAAASAPGNFATGQKLHDWWAASKRVEARTGKAADVVLSATFHGYVVGVADELERRQIVCLPETTAAQIAAMVGKWLDEHPSEWHADGDLIVLRVLLPAFPCAQ